MKTISTSLIVSLLTISLLLARTAYAQEYYVVVGAFANEANAKKFTGYVSSKFYETNYALKTSRSYFYVYILRTTIRQYAYEKAIDLQHNTEFKDAWVYTDKTELIANDSIINVARDSAALTPEQQVPMELEYQTENTLEQTRVTQAESTPEPVSKLFKFIATTEDDNPITGEIHAVDYQAAHDLASYKLNECVAMPKPLTRKSVSLVCGIFGYKEVVKQLDFDDPTKTEGVIQDENGTWVIPYKLKRLKKGDASIMYHVYFYKDAVIMLAPSQTEIDELVNMMNSNIHYKIKVHAHCNGTYSRKIIAMGEPKNYFDITGSVDRNGSAKELTRLRGEAIKSYLVDKGIDKSRIQVNAWGGQDMLVAENSASSKLNDRIEIEILKD